MRIPSVDRSDSLAVSLGIFLIAGLFLATPRPLQSAAVKRGTTLANETLISRATPWARPT